MNKTMRQNIFIIMYSYILFAVEFKIHTFGSTILITSHTRPFSRLPNTLKFEFFSAWSGKNIFCHTDALAASAVSQ